MQVVIMTTVAREIVMMSVRLTTIVCFQSLQPINTNSVEKRKVAL